jgi:hypothetical protein
MPHFTAGFLFAVATFAPAEASAQILFTNLVIRQPNFEFTIVNGGSGCALESSTNLLPASWTLYLQDPPENVAVPKEKPHEFFRVRCGDVFSANLIGYINLSNPPGWWMVANQLQGTSITVPAIFPDAPEGAGVFKPRLGKPGYNSGEVVDGAWEFDGSVLTLAPGEGMYMFNPSALPYRPTLIGEVVLNSSITVHRGFFMYSTVVPQEAGFSSVHGFEPVEGTGIFGLRPRGYLSYEFVAGAWEPLEPRAPVGESFWIFNPGEPLIWDRRFAVGP